MGHRVGCHRLEDHEHMLRHCRFTAFVCDTVRKGFGMVQREGENVQPSRLLLDEPALSLQSSPGLVLWASLKAQWSVRGETRFQGTSHSVEGFVAEWLGLLEVWRSARDMSLSRSDPPAHH